MALAGTPNKLYMHIINTYNVYMYNVQQINCTIPPHCTCKNMHTFGRYHVLYSCTLHVQYAVQYCMWYKSDFLSQINLFLLLHVFQK